MVSDGDVCRFYCSSFFVKIVCISVFLSSWVGVDGLVVLHTKLRHLIADYEKHLLIKHKVGLYMIFLSV